MQLSGILQGFVEIHETTNHHAVKALLALYLQVEVAHQEVGEVEACHLVEQLVLVDGIRLECQQESKRYVAVG